MLKSYLKSALRALTKRPGYAFLNIAGLAIGLACFGLILMFVQDELSYDAQHKDADRIYRVAFIGYPPGSAPDRFAVTSPPIGRTLRSDFPEVESVVRINPFTTSVTYRGEKQFDQEFWYAEADLFNVFTLPVVNGPDQDLLVAPNTAVITESTARRIFGNTDPVGKTIAMNDTNMVSIQAVIADFPSNSHFRTDYILSYATLLQRQPEGENWLSMGVYTYLKLRPGVNEPQFATKVAPMINERFAEQMQQMGFDSELVLEPLRSIYLKSKFRAQIGPTGDMTQVWVFSAIAVFVLLLACINFTNLATARSMERAREVGVRKVSGSSRGALVVQFLSESVVMALVALVLALGIMLLALPMLNTISGKTMSWSSIFELPRIGTLFVVAVGSGLLAGLYPAVVMSGMKSVSVLKGSFHASPRGALLRKGLVALQFTVSIGLIAGTGIVANQLKFMRSQSLGFDQQHVLVIETPPLSRETRAAQVETMKAEFAALPGVASTSVSNSIPGRGTGKFLFGAEGVPEDEVKSAQDVLVDDNYFANLGIPIVAGRSFSADFPTDPDESIVINETMVRYLNWGTPQDALGKTIEFGGGDANVTVIGVAADHHHNSLKEVIEPMMFRTSPAVAGYLVLHLDAGDPARAITQAQTLFERLYATAPFNYFFLDQDYNRQYLAEDRLMKILTIFAGLAILVACLGLIGLAAFTAQQRTKEVGVRKVLGASAPGLMALLSKEFAVLVGVGLVLAIPITFWGMHKWLASFPYSAGISPLQFLWAGLAAMAIALLSVSYQAWKTAMADPVVSLRYE